MRKLFAAIVLSMLMAPALSHAESGSSPPTTLSVTLANLHITESDKIEGDVTIENKGSNDTQIVTGFRAGGAEPFIASQFLLFARNAQGTEHEVLTAGAYGFINGRIVMVVQPLPIHSVQTVHARWKIIMKEGRPNFLPPDTYTFYAQYTGSGDDIAFPIECTYCWTGTVKSNEVSLTVP